MKIYTIAVSLCSLLALSLSTPTGLTASKDMVDKTLNLVDVCTSINPNPSYIVVFKDTIPISKLLSILKLLYKLINLRGGKITHFYPDILKGFTATLPHQLCKAVFENSLYSSLIDYVELDQLTRISDQ
ncbi:hypothetical protein L0F63_006285 [Massospora cicadina]|nr:hypothetical protein L0F63_006285 [Massospora cicadina]